MKSTSLLLALSLCATAAFAEAPADAHLFAGAREFRAGHFAEALVEFRVAEKLGAGSEASWYAGAALVKLDRADEALEAFDRAPNAGADALLGFYRVLALHQLKLYTQADRQLAALEGSLGPRLAGEAGKLRQALSVLLHQAPSRASVDYYFERAHQAQQRGAVPLARAYLAEAGAVAARSAGCYRCGEADSLLAALSAARDAEVRTP